VQDEENVFTIDEQARGPYAMFPFVSWVLLYFLPRYSLITNMHERTYISTSRATVELRISIQRVDKVYEKSQISCK
jgi:hypothetical protein